MQVIQLLILIIAFSLILGFLVFLYVYRPAQKRKAAAAAAAAVKKEANGEPVIAGIPNFDHLVAKIKKTSSEEGDLRDAAEKILKYYGTIKPKRGVVPDKDFRRYAEVIFAICSHPNTTKEVVLMFDRGLVERNPEYAREIDEMLNRGLSARV